MAGLQGLNYNNQEYLMKPEPESKFSKLRGKLFKDSVMEPGFIESLTAPEGSPVDRNNLSSLAGSRIREAFVDPMRRFGGSINKGMTGQQLSIGDQLNLIEGMIDTSVGGLFTHGVQKGGFDPNTLHMFVGPKAKDIVKAESMVRKGASPEDIQSALLMHKKPDGMWRKEVSDAVGEGKIRVYHTGTDKISKIDDSGTFGSTLFFADEEYKMTASPDYHVYSTEIDPDNVLTPNSLFYDHEVLEFQNDFDHVISTLGVDKETAEQLLEGSVEVFDGIDMDTPLDLGEASWFIQQKQSEIANKLGYDAAELMDEQGTAWAIPMKGREKDLVWESEIKDGKRTNQRRELLPDTGEGAQVIMR
ncbi:unnamed protein product [marine sediment metagenome]|uniref:Uncharacterized protein n=1 Tax=marine sediment metagenome TaxID=412755 RepID=X0SB83_9ZZZZ